MSDGRCKCMHCKEACDHDKYWYEEVEIKYKGVIYKEIWCNACDTNLTEEHPEMFEWSGCHKCNENPCIGGCYPDND